MLSRPRRKRAPAAGLAAFTIGLLAAAAPTTLAAGSAPATPRLEVVAGNLDNPRKLAVGSDGSIYVVEAGVGGHDTCVGTGAAKECVGLTGSIAKVAGGSKKVVTGLWSVARSDRQRAEGPAQVLVRGDTYYVLMQDTVIDRKGANVLGPDGVTGGDLISTPGGSVKPTVIANLARFEAAHNPDHGAGPGPAFGDPPLDSDPYAFTPYRGGFAVVDAAGDDLLWIDPKGSVSLLAVFPTRTEKVTAADRRTFAIPANLTTIRAQSVPTSVAVGPDGALYVGELTGLPFRAGAARVWRVVPGRKPAVYASGFSAISDLAFLGRNLLVLELAARGVTDTSSPGALIELAPDGTRSLLASPGLVDPTGLAVTGGFIYISNDGFSPGTGPGRHGELVRLRAP